MTAMHWRLGFLLAAVMIVFSVAHMIALQKLNVVPTERPATIDSVAD